MCSRSICKVLFSTVNYSGELNMWAQLCPVPCTDIKGGIEKMHKDYASQAPQPMLHFPEAAVQGREGRWPSKRYGEFLHICYCQLHSFILQEAFCQSEAVNGASALNNTRIN